MCQLSSSICSSPIGRLNISYCSKGLHAISQISSINDASFKPFKNKVIEVESTTGTDPMPDSCLTWLQAYFHSPGSLSKSPDLCPNVISIDSFQSRVWRTLLDRVPFGRTITYGDLADLTGNSKAARAVGTAMRQNPFQLIVPCHRVIRSTGEIGNYAGGHSVKTWLLEHEKCIF